MKYPIRLGFLNLIGDTIKTDNTASTIIQVAILGLNKNNVAKTKPAIVVGNPIKTVFAFMMLNKLNRVAAQLR